MQNQDTTRSGFGWLECVLGLAALALLLQFFPSLAWAIDARNWSQLTWFVMNVLVILGLVGVRFGPDMAEAWQERCERMAIKQAKAEEAREAAEKARKLKEQREIMKGYKEARKRRIY